MGSIPNLYLFVCYNFIRKTEKSQFKPPSFRQSIELSSEVGSSTSTRKQRKEEKKSRRNLCVYGHVWG